MKRQRCRSFLPGVVQLEKRDVPTVTAGLVGGTLTVSGDNSPESIGVEITSNLIWVSGTGLSSRSFPTTSVTRLDIGGKGGDDTIWVNQFVPFTNPIRIFGDDGNDTIKVNVTCDGSARYSVDGGAGRDTLNIPGWMPVGPSGFPKNLAVVNVENSTPPSALAQAQAVLRLDPNMKIISHQIAAPITNGPTARTAANYQSVIEQFEVNAPYGRYAWDSNGTKCNIFAGDVLRAMGAPLPTNSTAEGV
jgi:hypothetical protein